MPVAGRDSVLGTHMPRVPRAMVDLNDDVTPARIADLDEHSRADRQAGGDASGPLSNGGHDLRERMRFEADTRLRGARAALARLDELAPSSGVPDDQVTALRALFACRVAHIEATINRARARAVEGAYPVAFWRVAAELLTAERQALAQLTEFSPTVSRRAQEDLAVERDQLVGSTAAAD